MALTNMLTPVLKAIIPKAAERVPLIMSEIDFLCIAKPISAIKPSKIGGFLKM